MKQPLQSHQHGARNRLEEVWCARVLWDDRVLEPTENWIEWHGKQEATRKTPLPDASGHEELSFILSCKYHVSSTIAANHPQKTTNELGELCLLKHMENPAMIDAGIRGGKIGQSCQFRRCYAWPRCISEMDVYISWCTIGGLGKSPW